MTGSRSHDNRRSQRSNNLALVNNAIQVGAIAALAFAVYRLAAEVPANGANLGLALVVLTAAGAAARRFVVPIFGRTEASGVWTVIWVALFVRDWPLAIVTAATSTFVGDALVRHLRLARVFDGTTRMIAGAGAAGLAFSKLGGEVGSNLLSAPNLPAVTAALLSLPVVAYTLSYLKRQRGVVTWSGAAYLAFRWEMIVGFVSAGLAVGWAQTATTSLPAVPAAFWGTALLIATVLLYSLVTKAVHNEERRWLEQLVQGLGAELSIAHGFDQILDITRQLVPCEHIAFYSYDPTTDELHTIVDSESNRSPQLSVHEGLAGSAVRLGKPVIHDGDGDPSNSGNPDVFGSELMTPLFHGHELVGLWSVRHSERHVYGPQDASLLALMSGPLILSLSVGQLLRPIAASSHHTAQSLRKVETTRETLHGVARVVEDASGRALEGVQLASEKIGAAIETLTRLVEGIDEVAQSATESTQTSRSMSIEADNLKSATAKTAAQLTRLEDTIRLGTGEVERLNEAATEVEGFSQAISAISNQTNLLALNATIESARAGTHGRGFRVVAEKVRDLANQSARAAQNINRSAQKTRKAIDGSTQIMDDIQTQLREMTEASAHWTIQLREITTTAEVTRANGEQLARMPIANRSVADETRQILDDANRAAVASTEAARIVAKGMSAQVTDLAELARGTAELSDLAQRLDKGLQLLGGGTTTNGADR